ncbi:MAG: FG-GAP repeat protein, partial [Thioalkalivibrio sp.]|nr:FG-GAP repeat protein [Thioalkalivibrio sp.]
MHNRSLLTGVLALAVLVTTLPASAQEPNFGRAVAMAESDLFIGQPVNWYGPGVVYAYRMDGSGQWGEASMLTPTDSSRMDDFGRTLALDGNTLVVGAPRKRDGTGVAYAFERASAGADWRQVAVIEPPRADDHSEYAAALALSGDDLLVGSPAAATTGVVYHFRRAGGAWRLQGVIQPTAGAGAAGFGRSLSWEGDRLLVGAPAADSARGRVYAVDRQADGTWGAARAVTLPSDSAEPGARAGSAVLLAGDRAYVGAPGGATVFALQRSGTGNWSAAGVMQPSGDPRGTQFGFSIAVAGNEVWV